MWDCLGHKTRGPEGWAVSARSQVLDGHRALLLGRDESVASAIALQLTARGIRVDSTASLRMASTKLTRGGIDLLLVDAGLSAISAREFLEKAREFVSEVPRVFLVLEGEEAPSTEDIESVGAAGVLSLPVELGWLEALLTSEI
jgi:DNA-binding response OmpR family regulator